MTSPNDPAGEVTASDACACGEALVHELFELLSAAGVLRTAIGQTGALHGAVPEWERMEANLLRDEQALMRAADHLDDLVRQLQSAVPPGKG